VNDSVVHRIISSDATSEPTASIAENPRLTRVEGEVRAASARSNSRTRISPTIVAVDGGAIVTGVRQGLYEFDEPAVVSDQMDRSPVDSPATHGDGS
jgi:hypothetical protein